MKKRLLFFFVAVSSLALSSCGFFNIDVNPSGGSFIPTGDDASDDVEVEGITSDYADPNADPISKPGSGLTSIKIVAINDFHGHVENKDGSMGLLKLGSYFLEQSNTENTLIIDQGDTFQGALYSNYNHGKLITDVYSYAHVHARTVGNHDFDWGIDKLKACSSKEILGYKTPVLAANVYDYDFATKVVGENQQSDIGVKTVSYTLKNGLKVGIVGVIGKSQITSITTKLVDTITFTDHIEVIKEEAANLRNDGCDLVIASCHTGQGDLTGNDLSDYVDLVLCGHTHYNESTSEGNLHYYQFGAYGEGVGEITLTYNYSTSSITSQESDFVSDFSDVTVNDNIRKIYNAYYNTAKDAGDIVVANDVRSAFYSGEQAANLMCKAILDQTKAEKFNVVLSMCNTARELLPTGTWKYADLYESFPFDNVIYIIDAWGSEILNEMKYGNNVCFNPTFDRTISSSKRYRIAVLDYLAFHSNESRSYNYFPSVGYTTPIGTLKYNYRVILGNWLNKNGYNKGKTLKASDYSNSVDQFDKNTVNQ